MKTLSHLLPLYFLLTILSFTAAQDSSEIECLLPARIGTGPRPVYKTGETVQFQWKSTFPMFDLTITQVNSKTGAKTNDKRFGTRRPPLTYLAGADSVRIRQ